jgi:hypothetical protein
MKFAGQPHGIASFSHFDQLVQGSVTVVVDHHPHIARVSVAIFHAIIVRRRARRNN